MATKKKQQIVQYDNPPESLHGSPFFGIVPDEDQQELIDAVWKREKKVYLVDSIAGSGKTLISTALGILMVKYGFYNRMVYITFPGIYEKTQGFLPGDLVKKSEPYFQPLYDALIKLNEDPSRVCNTSDSAIEFGDPFIECAVSTYMRGINIDNAFVIIDEAENADLHTLAKVLSRINDNCLTIVIGHSGQCDMYDKTKSGFTACIDYQTKYHPDICQAFTLRHNHRGWVSQWADMMLEEYQEPQYGFIYMTRNKVNGKLYIGQHKRTMNPKDINDEWYLGSGTLLKKALVKYGEENFERTILYECDNQQHLNYMEEVFIAYYNAVGDDSFYNLATGGFGSSSKFTEEHKQHLRHPHKPMSEESRKKMARVFTEETKQKISNTLKSKGIKLTEEHKRRISETHKGYKCMYKDGVFKHVTPDEFDQYLEDGWEVKSSKTGLVWIHNGDESKMVKQEKVDSYLSDGWELGRPPSYIGTNQYTKASVE